jgi:hypothetical protein
MDDKYYNEYEVNLMYDATNKFINALYSSNSKFD